jgi:hypothetical protein
MREPGHAALLHQAFRYHPIDQLEQDPKPNYEYRRDAHDLPEEAEEQERMHPSPWEKKDVGAEDARDCAARPYHRYCGTRLHERMPVSGSDPREEVKEYEPEVTYSVFYIVPEYPQV